MSSLSRSTDEAAAGRKRSGSGDEADEPTSKIATAAPAADRKLKLAQSFIESIKCEPKRVDEGEKSVKFINGVMENITDPLAGQASNVILRQADVKFWTACLDELIRAGRNDKKRLCVVGSPGIGKTTTTPFAIRELLWTHKKTVIYRIRDTLEPPCLLFTPGEDGEVVTSIFPYDDIESMGAVYSEDTYFIVDPGATMDSCDPPQGLPYRVIIVASPDDRHWGGNAFAKKTPYGNGGYFRYFPPWSLNELLNGFQYLDPAGKEKGPQIAEESVRELHHIFGGIPRLVFALKSYLENKDNLDDQLEGVSVDNVRKIVKGNLKIRSISSPDQPGSSVLVLHPHEDENRSFAKVQPELASPYVATNLRLRFLKELWVDIGSMVKGVGCRLLEDYMAELLTQSKTYSAHKWISQVPRTETVITRDDGMKIENSTVAQREEGTPSLVLGGCSKLLRVADCAKAVKENKEDLVLYHSVEPNHALYDMIYRNGSTYYAFQVTLGATHSMSINALKSIIKELDFGKGNRSLVLVYAAHECWYNKFKVVVDTSKYPNLDVYDIKLECPEV